MKIAVLDDYQDVVRYLDCFSILEGHEVTVFNESYGEEALVEKLKDIEAVVLIRERTLITASLLEKLPSLKLISQTGKISNHIDPEVCKAYNVEIAEGRGSPVAPSELCWALLMAATRDLPAYVFNLQRDQWQQSGMPVLGRTLNGLTLGIWGYGKIGQRIAKFAEAFGMQVMVWGSEGSRQNARNDGYLAADSKAQFFSNADIISLHLRLNDVTRSIVTRDDLALMKPDSLLVNISRAELIEPGALYQELSENPSKRAAIDVFDTEPATSANEPLLTLPNVLATPHLGYVEQNSYELYFSIAFENVVAYAEGRPENLVSP